MNQAAILCILGASSKPMTTREILTAYDEAERQWSIPNLNQQLNAMAVKGLVRKAGRTRGKHNSLCTLWEVAE